MVSGRFEDFSTESIYSHAKAYRKSESFRDLAFFDLDTDRAKELAAKAGGSVYASVSEIMSGFRPDAVSVCTPDDLHFSYAKQVMLSGFPPRIILIEKPVCNTMCELTELSQLESLVNTRVIVNHSRRFDEAHQQLRALLNSNELGPPVRIHVDYYGGWRHIGVHIVDILQYLFDDVMALDSVEYCCGSRYADDPTLNVTGRIGNAVLRFDGFEEAFYQVIDMNIMCQSGQIKITDFGKHIEVLKKAVNQEFENVLVHDKAVRETGMKNCMTNTVKLICSYLDSGDQGVIEPYGLRKALSTMTTIWTGSKQYAAQS